MSMKIHSYRMMGVIAATALMLITSCARMGQPDGGWYDETPPRVINTSPKDRATGVTQHKINIYFDEFIKLEDAANKVVVSPPQIEMPEIATKGKHIVVELKDTLQQNTTYTVDFSDAIVDNNEGNPMGSYTYCFSTGTEIDTFEVAGTVIAAENLEPVKGILVGLHSNLSDTIFAKKPLRRVARTDSRGHFTIKGVAPGSYRVYALNDMDGDYTYSQRSEMLAFSHRVVVPSCKPDIRQDTVWRDTLHIDSIARVPYIHFLPDDVVLRAFLPEQTDRHLLKTERTDHRKIGVYFTGMHDSLPVVKGLNFDASKAFFVEASPRKDTLTYWLKDSTLINRDSLEMALSYYATDTTGVLVLKTDTLTAIPKMSFERREKMRLKELEKWEKQQEKEEGRTLRLYLSCRERQGEDAEQTDDGSRQERGARDGNTTRLLRHGCHTPEGEGGFALRQHPLSVATGASLPPQIHAAGRMATRQHLQFGDRLCRLYRYLRPPFQPHQASHQGALARRIRLAHGEHKQARQHCRQHRDCATAHGSRQTYQRGKTGRREH